MSHNKTTSLRYAKLRSLSVAGLILGALFLIPALGLAQPASSPPGGNVDAQFDTVTVGPSLFNYFIGPGGGSDTEISSREDIIMNMNSGLSSILFPEPPGDTGVYTLAINSFGLDGADNGVVPVNDALMVTGSGQLGTGLGSQSFVVDDPSGSYMELGENGIYITGPDTAGPYGDTGIYVNNGGGNAIFAAGSGTTVLQGQGTPSFGIASFYNTSSASGVSLALTNGESINADGRMELDAGVDANPSSGSGTLEIDGALRLDSNEIITNSGASLYLQNDNNGDLYVDGGTVHVDASTNTLNVNGSLRANSIGGFLNYTYGSSCSGSGCTRYVTYSCPSGTYLMNCGANSTTYYSRITDVYASGNTCVTSGVSETSGTFTLYAELKCWDPDG